MLGKTKYIPDEEATVKKKRETKKDRFFSLMKIFYFAIYPYVLTDNPTILKNRETGEVIRFKSLEDAYENAMIDGKTIESIIESNPDSFLSTHMFMELPGGKLPVDMSDVKLS